MKRSALMGLLLFGALALSSCVGSGPGSGPSTHPVQGGTEFGNPTTISGTLNPPPVPSGTIAILAAPCGADTLVAVNAEGQSQQATVGVDCRFSMSLAPNQAYSLRFEAKGVLIARLVANPGESFPIYSFFLSASGATIDLGAVQLEGNLALPTHSPLSQLDRDHDGLADASDPDDDNDGVADVDERDCDFDGFIDDDDPASSCAPLGALKPVIAIDPFMNQTGVALTQKVQARFGCAINQGLFNASSFVVKASGGSTFLPCAFTFSADSKTLVCEHNATPFLAGTAYQGILGEIDCQDGAKTQNLTWTWTVAP